jgi:hypothetical protein
MASEGGAAEGAGQESIVLASFESRHAAEHMLLIAEAGPNAAIALVRCKDVGMAKTVAARAADRGRDSWHGSLAKFLAGLGPGSEYGWVREALEEPSSAAG